MDRLPENLAVVFRSLRSGKHICREDGAEYRDLDRNEEQYRALFRGLGYDLVHHGQGFYYFKGNNQLSTQRLQAIALFTLILFQDLEDNKFKDTERAWERTLLMQIFKVGELPHFQTAQRKNLLFAVGVVPESLYDKVLRPMARYGFLEMIGPDQFQFRSPIYRFVEACMQFAQEDWSPVQGGQRGQGMETPAPTEVDFSDSDENEAET